MRLKGKFQMGGPVPAEAAAPAPEQAGGDPMAQLLQGAQEAAQTGNCDIALQVCQMLLELAGGSGAPAGGAPEEAAPAPAEGEPVFFRSGGSVSLRRKIKK